MDRVAIVETKGQKKSEWVTPELSCMSVEKTLSGLLAGPIEDALTRLQDGGGS